MSNLRPRSTTNKQPSVADKPAPKATSPDSSPNSDTDPDTPDAPVQLEKSFQQRAISQTLNSTANIAKLLPSGTLLAFQMLVPIFTQNGTCDSVTRSLTIILLFLLAGSCFLACFTDTVKASDGQVYHGFATSKGLWLFDYAGSSDPGSSKSDSAKPDLPDLRKYKRGYIDWVHAVLSVLVFGAVALRDNNVLQCFYPSPAHETKEVLDIVPMSVGLLCSLLFGVFPTKRHGIGYPLAAGK